VVNVVLADIRGFRLVISWFSGVFVGLDRKHIQRQVNNIGGGFKLIWGGFILV